MIDFRALADWAYTDWSLIHLPIFDLDIQKEAFVRVAASRKQKVIPASVPLDMLETYPDMDEFSFDGFVRKLGPWTCYLNRLVDGWQWEILSNKEECQPIWDMSSEIFEWQSQAAEGLFARYPQLYDYTKEKK